MWKELIYGCSILAMDHGRRIRQRSVTQQGPHRPMPLSKIFREPSKIQKRSKRQSAPRPEVEKLYSEQLIDVWEHAALLYHSYEWQAAAEMFELLSREIEDIQQRALCLLNTGLIQARLGDYDLALLTFKEIVELAPTLLITHFLISLVECSRSDYSRAESSIEACILGLPHSNSVDYSTLGVNFVLNRQILRDNLREVRKAQANTTSFDHHELERPCLHGIPAEYIFEAPPRLHHSASVSEPRSRPQLKLHIPCDPVQRQYLVGGSTPDSGYESKLVGTPDVGSPSLPLRIPRAAMRDPPEDSADAPGYPSTAYNSTALSSTNLVSASLSKHQTWHRRPSTPYTPRNAHGEYESVTGLARFIRKADHAKAWGNLMPKDARGEHESVEELARFVQLYAPDQANEGEHRCFDIDPHLVDDLRRLRILNRAGDRVVANSTSITPLDGSGGVITPAYETTMNLGASPRRRSEPCACNAQKENGRKDGSATLVQPVTHSDPCLSDSPSSRDNTLEILQPRVYQPPTKRPQAEPSCQDRVPFSVRQAPDILRSSSSASSIDSVYNGLNPFERRIMARRDTLKALEGDSMSELRRNHDILPWEVISVDSEGPSVSSGAPSVVSTGRFLERVIGHRKK